MANATKTKAATKYECSECGRAVKGDAVTTQDCPVHPLATIVPAAKKAAPKTKAAVVAELGRRLGFETLESRGADMLDFKEVGVWSIKEALEAAYEAGRSAK